MLNFSKLYKINLGNWSGKTWSEQMDQLGYLLIGKVYPINQDKYRTQFFALLRVRFSIIPASSFSFHINYSFSYDERNQMI